MMGTPNRFQLTHQAEQLSEAPLFDRRRRHRPAHDAEVAVQRVEGIRNIAGVPSM